MNYKATIDLINKPGNLKGIASVTINDEFVVTGLRLYKSEDVVYVSMPSRKVGENYEDICFPVTGESREALHKAVIEAYEKELYRQKVLSE